MTQKVAIIGLAEYSAPYDLERFDEIWAINNAGAFWDFIPDLIVALDDLRRDEKIHPRYVDEIVNAGCPVLNTFRSRKWPSVKPYPLQEVRRVFPNVRLYDNSCNYAFMLALVRKWREIHFFGVDWCRPDQAETLECAMIHWRYREFENPPNWFKYYESSTVAERANMEPGSEAFHYLLGWAEANGVACRLHVGSTLLNNDRERYFYGYEKQPTV